MSARSGWQARRTPVFGNTPLSTGSPSSRRTRTSGSEVWFYDNALQRSRAPRGACSKGRSGHHPAGEASDDQDRQSRQTLACSTKRSTAGSRFNDPSLHRGIPRGFSCDLLKLRAVMWGRARAQFGTASLMVDPLALNRSSNLRDRKLFNRGSTIEHRGASRPSGNARFFDIVLADSVASRRIDDHVGGRPSTLVHAHKPDDAVARRAAPSVDRSSRSVGLIRRNAAVTRRDPGRSTGSAAPCRRSRHRMSRRARTARASAAAACCRRCTDRGIDGSATSADQVADSNGQINGARAQVTTPAIRFSGSPILT
jgi:hypothetical protein